MKALEFKSEWSDRWDDFIRQSNNGTIFHTQRFLNYHPEGRFENNHLVFEDRGRWRGALPGAARERDGKRIFVSHPGASFGGIAVSQKAGIEATSVMVDRWLEWAAGKGYEGVEFTRVPIIYHKFPEEHQDFALILRGADIVKRELTAVLRLFDNPEWNFELFRPEARTATRKASKAGVKVISEGDIPGFYEILKANLYARHNVTPTHTLEELLDLKRRFPDKIHQFNAVLNGKILAGVTLWEVNERAVIAFYISHSREHQEYRPLNLVFWEIFQWAIARKFAWLDFGTYTLDMDPNFGLARFKESFGARGIFRDTLRLIY